MKKFLGYVLRLLVVAMIVAGISELMGQRQSPPADTGSRESYITMPQMSDPPYVDDGSYESYFTMPQLIDLEPSDPAERYKNSLCGVALPHQEEYVYCVLRDAFSRVSNGEQIETEFKMDMTDLRVICLAGTLVSFDIGKIQTALWMDCPDVMYWNYRSKGWEYEYEYERESESFENGYVVSLTVRCEVLPEYAPNNGEKYRTDPEKILEAKSALQNAQALVDQCSGLSDYDKLAAYRDYICDQVEYDYTAAALPNEDKGKGPWQIINVFDQDPATNVVCEGYAKSFKYLCDLSEFTNDVSCYLVDGTVGGPHAWNLVRINSQSYMADITNCDSDWGRFGGLFLAGAEDATWGGFTIRCPRYDLPDGSYYEATDLRYTYSEDTGQLYLHDYLTLEPANYDPQSSQIPQM